jgi:dihydrofolate reductase
MSLVTCDLAVSVDGFVAGQHQSLDDPVGRGGMRLHTWHQEPEVEQDAQIARDWMKVGAHVMGRNMFGPGRGEWDPDWRGWWGEEPPYGVPVFVLTHHEREPLAVGATTFHFVTGGPQRALELAREAAGELPVAIAGGASTANQYLADGSIHQLHLHVVPIVLGSGERLFDGVPPIELAPVDVVGSPHVTHVKYRIGRGTGEDVIGSIK